MTLIENKQFEQSECSGNGLGFEYAKLCFDLFELFVWLLFRSLEGSIDTRCALIHLDAN